MSRRFSTSNFLAWFSVSILLIDMLATCTQQPSMPEASQVTTAVSATLTAMPTATVSLPKSAITPSGQTTELLDRRDFQSVLRWVVFSLEHKRLDMLAEVIGEHEVEPFSSYMGRGGGGKGQADYIIPELRMAVEDSTPRCAGYSSDFTSNDESAIYFYGVEPNWSDLLGTGSRIVSAATVFEFLRLGQGWELVAIGPVRPEGWPNLLEILLPCP